MPQPQSQTTDPYAAIASDPYRAIAVQPSQAPPAQQPAATPQPPTQQPQQPSSLWERTKGIAKHFIDNATTSDPNDPQDDFLAPARGFTKEGIKSVAGLLDIYRHMGDVGSPKDVQAYMEEHPGSSAEEAMAAVKGGMQTSSTGKPAPPYRAKDNRKAQEGLAAASKWLTDHAHTDGFLEGIGGVGENLTELLTPAGLEKLIGIKGAAEAGKTVSMVDRLKQSQQVAEVLEKYPLLEKLLGLGIRTAHAAAKTGAETGAQTFVKTGGDTEAAGEAAAIGAGAAGIITPVAEGGAAAVRHLAPRTAEIAGEEVPILRSQEVREGANGEPVAPSRVQQTAASIENSPKVKGAQQGAAKRTITNEAQRVVEQNIPESIEFRRPAARPAPQEAPRPQPGGEPTGEVVDAVTGRPTTSEMPGVRELPSGTPQLPGNTSAGTTELAERGPRELPGSDTRGPRVTTEPLPKELPEGRMREQLGSGAPDEAAEIPRRYARSAIKRIGNFGDAAQEFRTVAKSGYDWLNENSQGRWQALNDSMNTLEERYLSATNPEARQAAKEAFEAAERNGSKMIEDSGMTPNDVAGMKRAWQASYDLQALHNTIEKSFDISENLSKNQGVYRGFNGDQLNRSFKRLLEDRPRVKQWIGQQGIDNLEQVFAYNRSSEGRKRFGNAVSEIAGWLSKHTVVSGTGAAIGHAIGGAGGAAAGAAGSEAVYNSTRYVMHKVATDPKFAKSLLFALEAGANPDNYGPYFGAMISKGVSDNTDKGEQQ